MKTQGYTETTVFNSSVDCLERIGALLRECTEYSRKVKPTAEGIEYLSAWNKTLKYGLYQEIIPNVKDKKEITQLNELFRDYMKTHSTIKTVEDSFGRQKQLINIQNLNRRQEINWAIELELRRLATKYGMLLTKDKSDPRRAIVNM